MAAIAAEAGVALKTVYVAFETKSGVLRALWNLLLRGDEEDIPVAEQEWYRAVLEEPDPERQLRLNARNSRAGKLRIGAIVEVIRAAAPDRPRDRRALEPHPDRLPRQPARDRREPRRRRTRSTRLSTSSAPTDILWTINHPAVWQLLVRERGWTPEQYEQWSGDTAAEQLLRPGSVSGG